MAILCKSFNLESINSIALNYHINEDIKMSSHSQVGHGWQELYSDVFKIIQKIVDVAGLQMEML